MQASWIVSLLVRKPASATVLASIAAWGAGGRGGAAAGGGGGGDGAALRRTLPEHAVARLVAEVYAAKGGADAAAAKVRQLPLPMPCLPLPVSHKRGWTSITALAQEGRG